MRNNIKSVLIALISLCLFACEDDKYDVGSLFSYPDDQFSFRMIPGEDPFTYYFTSDFTVDPNKYLYTYEILFGDGKSTTDKSGTHEYVVLAGTYEAECRVYTPNGEIKTKTYTLTFTEDNPKAYEDDPESIQYVLTGGKDNTEGKEWSLTAGTGLGDVNGSSGEWWDISGEPALLNDVFVFRPNSIQANGAFYYNNNGDTFMNESLGGLFDDGDITGSFVTNLYTPASDATWEIVARDGKSYLVVHKGFLGYAIAPADLNGAEYEIMEFTATEVKLRYYSDDGNAWYFFLSSEEPAEVIALTGGKDAVNGKTWVLRESPYGIQLTQALTGDVWWDISPATDGAEAAYDDELTFFSSGKAVLTNNGDSYLNEATAGMFSDGNPDGSFVTTQYTPSENAGWKIVSENGKNYLIMSDIFPMYGLSPEIMTQGKYEITELTENSLRLYIVTGDGEWAPGWEYFLVPKQ
ncbi:MAG: hypothetical protein LUG18_06200 [Candidatus Azobacteroides sp.]|nr:hypothetical protein [Candidatus Azobacteroides sp.]